MDPKSRERHERRIPTDWTAGRIDRFLAHQPEVETRSAARSLLDHGLVELDGEVVKKGSTKVEPGQVVRFPTPEYDTERSADDGPLPELRVLFEDPYLLVIDKQAGVVAHPPATVRRGPPPVSVAELALAHCGDLPTLAGDDRPGIVHRLDKDTTGVMVVPKTDEAFHFVRSQFKARTVRKEYRAISFGEPRFDSDHIERNIGVHPRMGDRMTIVQQGGKEASTFYEVVERFRGFTDFRCKPRTGRTHQIRVHMTSIGHSLVGDRIYRARNASQCELPKDAPDPGRQCLHAERLTLQHPFSHEEIQFEAPVPKDMTDLLGWLRAERPIR